MIITTEQLLDGEIYVYNGVLTHDRRAGVTRFNSIPVQFEIVNTVYPEQGKVDADIRLKDSGWTFVGASGYGRHWVARYHATSDTIAVNADPDARR